MTKAIIFDCFGVLTTDGWKQLREEYFSATPRLLERSYEIDRAVNAGNMTYSDFIAEISDMSGLPLEAVRKRLNGSMPNTQLFEYIRDSLIGTYKIGMLSNAADNWLDDLFEPWQVALFDDVVLSCDVGTVKPERAMYEAVIKKLDVSAHECIFVDDSERYCVAAHDLGMETIVHTETRQTIHQLEELLSA